MRLLPFTALIALLVVVSPAHAGLTAPSTKTARATSVAAPKGHQAALAKQTAAKAKPAAPAKAITAAPKVPAPLPVRLARLTAYWTEEDYYTSKHMSSTGVHLHEGHCAVDPALIPYGSAVQIPGMGTYVAVDTGSAVVSRQAAVGAGHNDTERNALVVDLFFENRHEAEQFAANGPTYVSVRWSKPLTAADAPMNPRALPVTASVAGIQAKKVETLAFAPSLASSRLPLNFRSTQVF